MSKEFNWYTELNKAIKEEPSSVVCLNLEIHSYSWVIRACGELCNVLPIDDMVQPEDFELIIAGSNFSKSIREKKWVLALDILNKIEARTAQLLNEIKP